MQVSPEGHSAVVLQPPPLSKPTQNSLSVLHVVPSGQPSLHGLVHLPLMQYVPAHCSGPMHGEPTLPAPGGTQMTSCRHWLPSGQLPPLTPQGMVHRDAVISDVQYPVTQSALASHSPPYGVSPAITQYPPTQLKPAGQFVVHV